MGHWRLPNEEVAEVAAENADVLIPFASIDPHKGRMGVREARRLIEEFGVRGFKFHPSAQGFYPNDRMAYPLYEVIAAAGLPALFHTGQTGVGAGAPGGMGIRLKYSNPLHLDDVAADFPDLTIIMGAPVLSLAGRGAVGRDAQAALLYRPVRWSPKYFPPNLVQYANSILKHRVLFGSDFPVLTPDRWIADFEKLPIKPEVRPLIMRENALKLLGFAA